MKLNSKLVFARKFYANAKDQGEFSPRLLRVATISSLSRNIYVTEEWVLPELKFVDKTYSLNTSNYYKQILHDGGGEGNRVIYTLLSDIFAGGKFRGSQTPRNFCIFAELNFAVHVLEQISREFNFAVEWKFRFSILIKNKFIKWKERNGENED